MRCLWLEDRELSVKEDAPSPSPGEGEALVRVLLAGICATDLELELGYLPFAGVPGHEFVGEVLEAAGAEEWVGRRVVGEINVACGDCPSCRAGRTTHCAERSVLGIVDRDGALADELALPVRNLHEVPEAVSDLDAVFVEPLAAALEILEQVHLRPSDRAVVVGAGRLGQLAAQVLKLTGCDLTVVARYERQQEILASRNIETADADSLESGHADLVVEATGRPSGFDLARRLLRPRGTLVLKSTYKRKVEVDASSLVVDEISVVGSRCGPFPPALRLLERELLDLTMLVEARYPISSGIAAFEHAKLPGALKVVVEPGR
jgi:threonine dehydrogenase-like Zn-dependent dehydrogenase